MAEVERLGGATTSEGMRLRAPMAPRPAALSRTRGCPRSGDHVARVTAWPYATTSSSSRVREGCSSSSTDAGDTLADLVSALPDSGVVVVARSALGTLNHTMLTREAMQHRGIRQLGVVIGSWPDEPDVIERTNRDRLEALPEGLLGAIPRGAPGLGPTPSGPARRPGCRGSLSASARPDGAGRARCRR